MVLKAAATIDGMRKSGGGEDVLGLVGDQLEMGGRGCTGITGLFLT